MFGLITPILIVPPGSLISPAKVSVTGPVNAAPAPVTLPERAQGLRLEVILRAVFGAEGDEFDELRALFPPMIKIGSVVSEELDPKTFLAVVRMSIDPSVQLPDDTVAEVVSAGPPRAK